MLICLRYILWLYYHEGDTLTIRLGKTNDACVTVSDVEIGVAYTSFVDSLITTAE